MIIEEETTNEILNTVGGVIRNVIGEDYVDDIDIEPETTFADDLEMESIEIVEFAEKIREHYGEKVDFAQWISEMELDDIINLTIGEVVDYIKSCLI